MATSGGSRGVAPPPPLFLDQTDAQRAEKNFFGDRPPLNVWLLSNTEILQFSSKRKIEVVVVDLREISFTIKTFDFYNESPLKSVFIRQIS